MSVYAEWHWSCDECNETSEEPWGDEQAAADELSKHKAQDHNEREQR